MCLQIQAIPRKEFEVRVTVARVAKRFARVEDTCQARVQAFELAENISPLRNRLLYLNYPYFSTPFHWHVS